MRDVWVVGDRFAGFARLDGVTTVSQVAEVLDGEPVTLRLGQGVGPYERDHLRALLDQRGLADRVVVVDTVHGTPAGRGAVHEHLATNVLLGDVRMSDGEVTARLRLTGGDELLLDDQTSLQVQSMVVVEAIRQMLLAAYETVYRNPGHYIVWNGIQVDFESFLFPLPARLSCELEPVTPNRPASARIHIEQGNRQVASAMVEFTAYQPEHMAPAERRRAESALRALAGVLTMGVAA